MSNKRVGTSARGEKVDFDLLEITASVADSPPPSVQVQNHMDFVDVITAKSVRNSLAKLVESHTKRFEQEKDQKPEKDTKKGTTKNDTKDSSE